MAFLKSATSGNFTSASSWFNEDVTAQQLTVSSSTTSALTNLYTPSWTESLSSVVNGVVINVSSTSGVGTFTIGIYTSVGTTPLASVTVNTSDLVAGFNSLKFTSTATLSNASAYRIGISSSTAGSVILLGNTSPNFYKRVITTTTSAPAAGDTPIILQDITGVGTKTPITITMDSTSSVTSYGAMAIYNGGTLAYGVAPLTNYYLKMGGSLTITAGGTFTMGTLASPIPSSSTAKLEFVCIAAGGFGIISAGTVTTYGATKTVRAKLATNIAAAGTSVTTDVSTGWLSADVVVMPPTNRVNAETDFMTLSGDAVGSTISFTAGTTYAHNTTTTPTPCDVGNLTRNVSIFGQGTGFVGGNTMIFQTNSGGVTSLNYTQLYYIGYNSTSTNAGLLGNLSLANGSLTVQYCSIWGANANANAIFYYAGTQASNSFTFNNNVIVNGTAYVGLNANMTPSNVVLDNNLFIRATLIINRNYITLTNTTCAGSSTGSGISFSDSSITVANGGQCGTINNIITYGNFTYGMNTVGNNVTNGVISNVTAWRNLSVGIYLVATVPSAFTISGATLTSNGAANVSVNTSGSIYFKNITTNSNASFVTGQAFQLTATDRVYVVNSSLGVTVPETNGFLATAIGFYGNNTTFYNTTFGHPTIPASQSAMSGRIGMLGVSSMNHNGVSGSYINWQAYGTITSDTTIYNSSSTSMRMTPTSALWKTYSQPVRLTIVGGETATIQVKVRKSVVGDGTAYNGNQPRLMLLPNPYTDAYNYTVLTTASGAAGSWETLSYSFTPTNTGVYEFVVDCDGTTGWVNVDDWYTAYVKDTTKGDYWFNGVPYIEITGVPKERSVGFVY